MFLGTYRTVNRASPGVTERLEPVLPPCNATLFGQDLPFPRASARRQGVLRRDWATPRISGTFVPLNSHTFRDKMRLSGRLAERST